jgi:hypothetical protein
MTCSDALLTDGIFKEKEYEKMFFFPEHPFVKGIKFFLFVVWRVVQ